MHNGTSGKRSANLRFRRRRRSWKCCGGRTVETAAQSEMQVNTIGKLSTTQLDKGGLTLDLPLLQLQH